MLISVDEKSSKQALERAQGYLYFSNGKTFAGFGDRHNRYGAITLFGALCCYWDDNHRLLQVKSKSEFLDFMSKVISQYSKDQEIHLNLDNLSTHKKKRT